MKYLLIAEKPSLMRAIEDCYKNHKVELERRVGSMEFFSLSGHACRNAMPNEYPQWANVSWDNLQYPIIPERWLTKPRDEHKKGNGLPALKAKLGHCDAVICATDSDTEGYGIYYLICDYLGLWKIPTLRFVEHSLTDKEILHSLLTMTDMFRDPLHRRFMESYLIRSRADCVYDTLNLPKKSVRIP